ncbi:MAG: DUF930 domain-containing protein [Pseudomonadota bacterium]
MVLAVEQDVSRSQRRSHPGGSLAPLCLLASFAVHTILLGVAVIVTHAMPNPPKPPASIVVDLIPEVSMAAAIQLASPGQEDAAIPEAPPPEAEPAPALPSQPPTQGVLVRPTTMLANAALNEPGSRQAREALRTLGTEDRMEQLCDVEALEQIEAWRPNQYRPELLVAYAFADTKFAGRAVSAEGAAFRSGGHWYRLNFACEVSPNMERVIAFQFQVGEEIPRHLWEDHYLESGPTSQE